VLSNHGNTLRIASIAFKDENRCFGKNPLLVRLSGVFCTTKGSDLQILTGLRKGIAQIARMGLCTQPEFGLSRWRKGKVKIERGLLGLMAVDNQAPDDIDPEVGGAAMPGRLNLGDMLELVKDRFDPGPQAGQELVSEPHPMVFPVAFGVGPELDASGLK
jgi:hypothetical protein